MKLSRRQLKQLIEQLVYEDVVSDQDKAAASGDSPEAESPLDVEPPEKPKNKFGKKLSKEKRVAFRNNLKQGFKELRQDPEAFFKGEKGQKVENLIDVVSYAMHILPVGPIGKSVGVAAIAASIIIDIKQDDWLGLTMNLLLLTPRFMRLARKGVYGPSTQKAVKTKPGFQKIKDALKSDYGIAVDEYAKASEEARGILNISEAWYSDEKVKSMTVEDLKQARQRLAILAFAAPIAGAANKSKEKIEKQIELLTGEAPEALPGSDGAKSEKEGDKDESPAGVVTPTAGVKPPTGNVVKEGLSRGSLYRRRYYGRY